MEYVNILVLLTTLFIVIPGYLMSKKHKMIFAIIISLTIAMTAYNYVPSVADDLYRHHIGVYNLIGQSNSNLINILLTSSEKGEILSKILVSKLGNVNYLQFGITFITYSLLFYLIIVMNKKETYSRFSFLILNIFIISTISYIGIISNLYFTLSIVIFCIGIYMFYEKKKTRLSILLLILSFLIHSSMTVGIVLFAIFVFNKNKLNFKSITALIIMVLSLNTLIPWLHEVINNDFTLAMYKYYYAYILDTNNISRLHSLPQMILYYLKMLPFSLLVLCDSKNEDNIDRFTKYILFFIVAMSFLTSYSIRFIPIVTLLGYKKIIRFLNSKENKYSKLKMAYIIIILGIVVPNIIYQYRQIISLMFSE